jgi:hypothetical protein
MVLRIRLARFGKKHAPFYNIVVAHARYVTPQTFLVYAEVRKSPIAARWRTTFPNLTLNDSPDT